MTNRAPDWWTKALAEVVYGIRNHTRSAASADKWDLPGIRATIERLSGECSPADLARVMVNGADNPKMKTPGGITAPGPQWADTTKASTKVPTMCPDHPHIPLSSCHCQREQAAHATRMPANFRDLFEAARSDAQDDAELARQEAQREAQDDFIGKGRAHQAWADTQEDQ